MYDGPERRMEAGRIAKIEATVSQLVYILEEDSRRRSEFRERIEELLKDHTVAIYGDRDGLGLNSRVTTLETAHKNHQHNIRWAWGTLGALVIHQLWKIFSLSFVK